MNDLPDILESPEITRQATGFVFTEGPLWHPDDFWYFNDIRPGTLYKMRLGEEPEMIRKTVGGNGMTFDLKGRIIHCEGEARNVTRTELDGTVTSLVDRFEGGRFNRPNDVICHSDGSLYFTDPSMRRPFAEREVPGPEGENGVWAGARVYRVAPDDSISAVVTVEYPNGLALSPDEKTLYIANTRSNQYVHAIEIEADGTYVRRRIFCDFSGDEVGFPDGMKVDSAGRVFCTGPGGIWVVEPDGTHVGTIRFPEQAINMAFGGEDLCTLFVTAHTSVYTVRVKTPGQPHPFYLQK
ncbi:MAG: SMP-30/gluconolactonase/LRE family protein [Rhodospirillaceae bacterium]|nr:SMP-30/gluconolactonase/LRE family protein [Rhodospirillaceae bacterium]MDD9926617.1 SMP-30/gluconolactonase/LRE family protein [Rhodospirillaceae bacterium]